MKTPKIFRRMVAMAVTLAIALSLCAPVLAEMPPLPDLSSGIALLSQTNSAEERTFDIGEGSLKIDLVGGGKRYVWVGDELTPHIIEEGQKIVITGSTTDNRIVIDGDPSQTAELVLDNVKINSTDKSDYRNTHYTIRVLNGSLDLTLRGENVFQNVHIAIGMEGEGKDLTVRGDGTLDIDARDTSIQVNGDANFFLESTGRVTNLNLDEMRCTTEIKGKVTLTGGKLKADSLEVGHGGLEMTDGVLEFGLATINGDMKVTGGTVNVKKDRSDRYAWAADVADNVIIGDAETNKPVSFTIQGDSRCMTMHRDLLIQGSDTYVHIYGGGANAIIASGMVIKGGILDVSGIYCTGGSGEISGNTYIKTFSLINEGKKVEIGKHVRLYLMNSDRTGYLRTDFRGGTGWVVFDGDGDDMHVIPTYYNAPEQSDVQDPATYKNLNLDPGDVPEYYKIGDGPIEVVVCEDGSQLVYQSNNEAGYVDAGSSVRIKSSGKSTANDIRITRREGSTARASVILDNVNLNVRENECALTVECPADIKVERSSKLSRLWYGNRGVVVRNADVKFETDKDSTLTIDAHEGLYCENSTVTFENANVDIKGWNEKSAISGQNSTIIFTDGSKAKLRMLGNDSGVTATVCGSAMVYLSEQWEQGTAVTTEGLTSGWLLYGDKEDLRGMPTGCSLPDGVDLDQPTTYKPLNATTIFDVAESPVAVTVASDGQRTVNWNGQNYSIWKASDPIHITCTGQSPNSITVNNASNEATSILLDNVNINSTYAVALSTMGSTQVILQGDNTLKGDSYGIYSQLGSTTNGNVTIVKDESGATLKVSGYWDGIRIGNGTLKVEGVEVKSTGERGHGIEASGNVTLENTKATVTGARASIIGNIVSITGNSVVNAVTTDTNVGDGIVGNMTVSISGSAKVKAKKITSGTVTVGGTSMVYLTDQPGAEEEIGTYFTMLDGNAWLVYKKDNTLHSIPAGLDTSSLSDDTDPADYKSLEQKQTGYDIKITNGIADHVKAEKNTPVKVTAVAPEPKEGKSFVFKGWTVISPTELTPESGSTLSDISFTFKMPDSAVELKAEWEETDKPDPEPTTQHSITVWYGATDYLTAEEGKTVTAQTMAPVGGGKYTFKGWTVDEPEDGLKITKGSLDDLTFKFTMPDCDVELTAKWEENPAPTPDPKPEPTRYTVTVLNGYADRFHVKKDQIVTVTTTWPEDGGDYYFKGWTLEGPAELDITEGSLNDLNFKFRMPETNVKLTAEWEKTPGPTTQYSVTVTNGIADHPQAEKDTAVKVMTVQPKDGDYEFKGWTVMAPEEGLTITEGSLNDLMFTFTMPASDVALTANWEAKPEPDQYTVTVTGGTADHAKAKRNTSVEVTAVQPEDGKKYVFKGWTVNKPDELTIEKGSLEETSFIFRMPEENVELTAVWKEETESDSDSDGSGAVVIALAAGAAVWGGYEAVTRILLSQKLPEGAEIPASRKDLALLIWQTAGSPEPQAEPAFLDLADMTEDAAKAAQWCVEQGLLDLQKDGRFAPDGWVPKFHVIEVWDKAFPE